MSIGFYVILFWRSQLESRKVPHGNRRMTDGRRDKNTPRRRLADRGDVENLVLNHLFEDEETQSGVTFH